MKRLLLVCFAFLCLSACTSADDSVPPVAPTATLTPSQTVAVAVRSVFEDNALSFVSAVDDGGNIVVTGSMGALAKKREPIQYVTFEVQRRLYQGQTRPQSVTVLINGPLTDRYGNITQGLYARAVLTAATAAKFNWSNLGIEMAWDDYDSAYLRPGI